MTLYRDVAFPDRVENLAGDAMFVVATWASSYKAAHAAGIIASENWPAVMHPTLLGILRRGGSRAIVAAEPPDFLYGFIAGDLSGPLPVVWYVYVKAPYRRGGIARGLFNALGVAPEEPFLYACRTSITTRLQHKIRLAKFVPATARYTNYQEGRYENDHD